MSETPQAELDAPAVTFSVEVVIQRIHKQYTKQIVQLVNVNAETMAANETLLARVAELETENQVLREMSQVPEGPDELMPKPKGV